MGWNPSWETETRVLVGEVGRGHAPGANSSGSRAMTFGTHQGVDAGQRSPSQYIRILCRLHLPLRGLGQPSATVPEVSRDVMVHSGRVRPARYSARARSTRQPRTHHRPIGRRGCSDVRNAKAKPKARTALADIGLTPALPPRSAPDFRTTRGDGPRETTNKTHKRRAKENCQRY